MSAAPPPPSAQPTVRERFIAVVGNPNVGKSTLFNALTGLRQRVANYPGVTVDAREGYLAGDGAVRVVDLPGTYSLRPSSADEAIVERVLRGDGGRAPDAILVVLDATNLRRNLFLLSEVLDLGRPVAVAVNMTDEARRGGLEVPTARLAEATGVAVVETVATRAEGVSALKAALAAAAAPTARVWRFSAADLEERLAACPGELAWDRLRSLLEAEPGLREQEVAGRYAWVTETLTGGDGITSTLRSRTDRIDAVLLHPIVGPLIFLAVMAVVFQAIFTWAAPVMDGIQGQIGHLGVWLKAVLPAVIGTGALARTLTDLLTDGILAGVGAVVVFLPQILILFFFLGLLEDTGYMARAAFLIDRPLKAVGLSGRSFIPLMSSFACAIPGVLASRTIPSRFERLLTIAVAPLMTCSARLPVYVLLIAVLVPPIKVLGPFDLRALVLLCLYLAGLAAGAAVALVISRARRRATRGKELPMVVELPPYRRPSLKGVLLKLRIRGGDFLKRAGTVIFAVSVVLWVLAYFPHVRARPGETPVQVASRQIGQSVAGHLGHAIEPAIRPLGYDWKMGVGLIASFAARETFVSTLGVVYSVGKDVDEKSQRLQETLRAERDPTTGRKVYSLATVFSLLVFYVFALQCGSTVAVVKRETGSWRFAAAQLLGFLVLAYAAALVTYQGLAALGYA